MIRSLYTRIVVIFLVSVVAGTLLSFFMVTWAFREQLNDNLQIPLVQFGQDVARLYETFPADQAEAYVREMNQLASYRIRIYKAVDRYQLYGAPDDSRTVYASSEQVERVLHGEQIRINSKGVTIELIGIPFQIEGQPRAMFIEPVGSTSVSFAAKWLLNFALYALLSGSLVILVASFFLIRPIKQLTQATKHIAEGDFNVQLDIRQKGELGTLARSFVEMSRDLRRLEEMRRDFVSNVSHEVQSPLTSISGYALALKQRNLTQEQRDRYLDIIAAEAKRISRMSDSLLKLSQLESQPQLLRRSEFGLDEQIRRVVIALEPQWSAKQITFELELPEEHLTGDPDQLGQVWTNIIGNAIKFSPDGGEIAIRLTPGEHDLQVSITDQGIGIAPEDRERVFERFFMADRSRSRKYEGSGLGLAIVRQIVSLHGGQVSVEGEPGAGTTFTVTLPRIPPNSILS
ncbi:two-component sensor histidine kinase [Saccharibacillus sp. O16]|nr:two-component sensor histidine kinase [Saccharibacillus sp. O16]